VRRTPSSRLAAWIGVGAVAAGVLVSVPAPAAAASTLTWGSCGDAGLDAGGFQCSTLTVPKDRKNPKDGTVRLAVIRHPSTGTPEQRIGSLVLNPGGPGGAGTEVVEPIWAALPDEIKSRFDLVSWDPRGVGRTTPALKGCDAPWPDRPDTGRVNWAKVATAFQKTLAKANAECQAKNADLVPFMGTNENVEDLDRLRAALGDEKLTFWGISYGTRIGYLYALKHPERTRAIILDGSIDPAGTTLGFADGGSASDQAFGVFAQLYPKAAVAIQLSLAKLNTKTVPLPNGTELTRWDVIDFVYNAIAQERVYAPIADQVAGLLYALVFGKGEQQAAAAEAAVGVFARQPNSNAGGVFSVVNCLDYPGRPGLQQAISAINTQRRYGPVNGATTTTSFVLGCSGLSMKPDPVPLIGGQGPDIPLLILGATRDGSTPQMWTARMSRAFPQSRTVTYAGGLHGTWVASNGDCVNSVANTFVTTLALPATDLACPNSYQAPAGPGAP
jgi:pimeloyl-ACP methyl ester carboxylesterase